MNLIRLCSVFSCLFYCQVHASQQEDEKVCKRFRTRNLRKACLRTLGSTEDLRPALSMDDVHGFDRYPVYSIPPGGLSERITRSVDNGVGVSLNCTTAIHCPILGQSIAGEERDHIRNTSPWDFCDHVDPTRFENFCYKHSFRITIGPICNKTYTIC